MAGRKPKPTAVKKLEGNPGKRKLNKKEPVPAKGMPECPDWLLPEAKTEWERLCEKLSDDGLKGCSDYKKAAQIIKAGGYATSLTYVDKLCSIIERWNLTQYDAAGEASDVVKYYRVRKSWEDAKSQLGAYTILANAKAMADENPGYEVYDWNGKQVYPEVAEGAVDGMTNADCPFMVKVSIPDLNIRKGSGTNTAKTGVCTGVGVFTILEVREGKGSDAGWGRLKSGAGWISLSYCERV